MEARVGLLGRDVDTGLGYQNAEIAEHLGISRWLVPQLSLRHRPRPIKTKAKRVAVPMQASVRSWTRFIGDLDCLLFAERPEIPELILHASQQGIVVACIPNWEHLSPDSRWIRHVDLMICPTRATFTMLLDWRDRFQFLFDIVLVPWPIDTGRHRFRSRDRCRSFLYINGWGGCRARRFDGTLADYSRKGLDVVLATAALAPELHFIVCSQTRINGVVPSNIEIHGRRRDNRSIYDTGDVCFQPSHWEGIGLPLLECQAAGLPLVTTDAPPMNEYQPFATLPVVGRDIVQLSSQPFVANLLDPIGVVEALRRVHGQSLALASLHARQYVEAEHSWSRRGPEIRLAIDQQVRGSRIADQDLELDMTQ